MESFNRRVEEGLGENLIFLISLPRSGSTLLQHILASHSKVAATAEPWILFPATLALRQGALTADYNADIGRIALSEFLTQLDGGEDQYYAAIRKMALNLYDAYLVEHSKDIFLDKTSRYYQVLPELRRIFPKAKVVFLLRNPLAVLASFLEVMVSGNWKRLGEPGIRNDLLDGYRLMLQGIQHFGDDAIVVNYEDLVEDSETVVAGLCEKLGLKFEPGMLRYREKIGVLPGKLVDPKSIQKHQTPVKDYVHTWRSRFATRQEKHFAQSYLTHLGAGLVNGLGYSYDELASVVSGRDKDWTPLVRWDVLMMPHGQRSRMQRWELEIAYVWQKEGIMPAVRHIGNHITRIPFGSLQRVWWVVWKRVRNLPIVVPARQLVHSFRNQVSTTRKGGDHHL